MIQTASSQPAIAPSFLAFSRLVPLYILLNSTAELTPELRTALKAALLRHGLSLCEPPTFYDNLLCFTAFSMGSRSARLAGNVVLDNKEYPLTVSVRVPGGIPHPQHVQDLANCTALSVAQIMNAYRIRLDALANSPVGGGSSN